MPSYKSSKRVHDSDSDGPPAKRGKGSSSKTTGEAQKGDDGELYWEISSNRRVSVTTFKGKSMINIREYYEKDGKSLPGKKGIAMPMEQYETLLGLLPQIEEVLKEQGIKVGRPQYRQGSGKKRDAQEEEESEQESVGKDEEDEDEDEEEVKPAKKTKQTNGDGASKLDRFKLDKKNHDATSDEED